jgi:hypothetical protein
VIPCRVAALAHIGLPRDCRCDEPVLRCWADFSRARTRNHTVIKHISHACSPMVFVVRRAVYRRSRMTHEINGTPRLRCRCRGKRPISADCNKMCAMCLHAAILYSSCYARRDAQNEEGPRLRCARSSASTSRRYGSGRRSVDVLAHRYASARGRPVISTAEDLARIKAWRDGEERRE